MIDSIKKFFSSPSFLKAFAVGESETYVSKLIAVARVLLGLLLIHRTFDIWGFSILYHNLPLLNEDLTFTLIIALCILFGLFTPLAFLVYLFFFCISPKYAYSLFHQAVIILSWAMIFFGAGKQYSLDSLLNKRLYGYDLIYKFLYQLSIELNAKNIALARFIILTLYWGTAISAMTYHFYDPLWLQGKVLQLMFTIAYLNDFYWVFESWKDVSPITFDIFCKLSIYIQGIWELVMVPFMFFYFGRLFVIVQGLGFFFLCILIINLGYLPEVELIMWALLFAYPSMFKNKNYVETDSKDAKFSKPLVVFSSVALVSFLSFFFLNSGSMIVNKYELQEKYNRGMTRTFFRIFGQDRVNVFNKEDLAMGSNNITFYQVNDLGEKIRMVPFSNKDGARLDYLRNDLLYFEYSVKWRRLKDEQKFVGGDPSKPNQTSFWLAQQIAKLDFCAQKLSAPVRYRMEVYSRDLVDEELYDNYVVDSWTESKREFKADFIIDEKVARQIDCKGVYDLGPGHFSPRERF